MKKIFNFFEVFLLIVLSVLFLNSCLDAKSKNVLIKFDTNGGNEIEDANVNLANQYSLPTPVKEFYKFLGWYSDKELTIKFSTSDIKNETTLYAKWEYIKSTISFETNCDIVINPILQEKNTAVTAPENPTRTGYIFGGWYSDKTYNIPYLFNKMPEEDITVYGKWSCIIYNIFFEENGGQELDDINYTVEDNFSLPIPQRNGFQFLGWYNDINLENNAIERIEKNTCITMNLFAKWEIANFILSFEGNGTENLDDMEYTILSENILLPIPTYRHCRFQGWYTNPEFSGESIYILQKGTYGIENLYAKWYIPEYTISFNVNGGVFLENITFTEFDEDILLPIATKKGYYFAGWYDNEEFQGNSINVVITGSYGNKIFYAFWI